tara:strand:- start:155 stop:649 length:495 start_codon:yes stop_codon:yes gene_type:complete
MTEVCDDICMKEEHFIEMNNKFKELLNNHDTSYNEYIKYTKNNNTNEARRHYQDITEIEKKLNNILKIMENDYIEFNKTIRFNAGFLDKQNKTLQSRKNTVDNYRNIINSKKTSVISKNSALKNNNSLLELSKDKIKYYNHLNVIFGLLLIVVIIYIIHFFKKN